MHRSVLPDERCPLLLENGDGGCGPRAQRGRVGTALKAQPYRDALGKLDLCVTRVDVGQQAVATRP